MIRAKLPANVPLWSLGIIIPGGYLFWAVYPFFQGFHTDGMNLVGVNAQGFGFLAAYLLPARRPNLSLAVVLAGAAIAVSVIDWGQDGADFTLGIVLGLVSGVLLRVVMIRGLAQVTGIRRDADGAPLGKAAEEDPA